MIRLDFTPSEALLAEMREIDGWHDRDALEKRLEKLRRPEDFFGTALERGSLAELAKIMDEEKGPLEVLDIGVGSGESSLYLASRGHRVTALEPSEKACEILERVAGHLGVELTVCQGIAEVADQLSAGSFDRCLFNSSLHHCDDPARALANCRKILKAGGRVLLLNEPILKPFRTKGWYYGRLKTHPTQMGHYGGNEHVYYAWEYRRMLRKAGFDDVRAFVPASFADLRSTLLLMANARVTGGYVYSNDKLLAHFAWLTLMAKLVRTRGLGKALQSASLMPTHFHGVAP